MIKKGSKTKRLTPAEEGERTARQDAYEPKSDELNPKYLFQTIHVGLLIRCAGGDFDLVQMAKDELANRGLDLNGNWVGFKDAHPSSKRAENICPACNGEGELISGNSYWHVYECHSCAGVYSSSISLAEIRKYVLVDEWVEDESKIESEDKHYFDFRFVGVDKQVHRMHGWFDINSKKLLQLG